MDYVAIGSCILAVVLLALLAWTCKALFDARAQLKLEECRRADQDALNAARQEALNAQREALRNEFGELAAKLLGERQRDLVQANEASVNSLFGQLKEKIDIYEKEVEDAAGKNSQLGEHMKAQLASLERFATEARKFTAALTGSNKIQGNKGEAILAGILEKSGFQRGTHFDMQQGAPDEGRPDASIYDSMNKRVILIDAKMNIKDYLDACEIPDDDAHKAERAKAMKKHVDSVKRQIDNLSAKNYPERITPTRAGYSNLPLVAMFCPFNAVLEAALNGDPELMQYAYRRNVVLVTPLTLWGYLWLISWGWKQQAIESKFEEIKKLGGDVLSALYYVLSDLKDTGDALASAKKSFDILYNRMTVEKGKTSVARIAQKLMDYGIVSSAKSKQLEGMLASLDAEQPDAGEQSVP